MYSVLIVDDSFFMRTWIKKIILKNKNIITAEAENGLEAILQYRKLKPDLVLLDYNMPELSGLEVLTRILKINPDAKIIMCSALGTSFMIEECLLAGAVDFVTKPQFKNLSEIINQNLPT
ncbi:response regulator [Amphibacillus sp. Q70]|uniref:response regulator n=1 Tax=Amphibacillus sp. Q70 TaxID=3453416 RepID=UPI003F873395